MTNKQGYLRSLTAMAEQIVDAVHTRGPGAITAAVATGRGLIAPEEVDSDAALMVMLAAMVDPTRSGADLTAWTQKLDGGAAYLFPARPRYYRINEKAVGMALAGALPACALNPAELADVVSVLSQHMSPDDIALHLGAEVAHVRRWLAVPPPIAA
jgi:hypothetical protein